MHYENHLFWERAKRKYFKYFNDPNKIIEFGSRYINGTIRAYFLCANYVGVDCKGDLCVDVKCLTHEFPCRPETIDTVVSASMLEHDPYWKQSLAKMVEILKPDGVLIITWGAARNASHGSECSPDGGFYPLKAGLVIQKLEQLGMYIHEFQYERDLIPEKLLEIWKSTAGLGEVVLVAFKDRKYAIGEQLIDPLIDEDKI